MFAQMQIDLLKGYGKLVDAHTVSVDDDRVSADYIVLRTGQRPTRLQIKEQEFLHDGRDFLDLDKMPKRITFIGAGIISMEFATMAAKLGSEVHVIEYADRALAAYQENYVKSVVAKMTTEGVHFHFNQAVQAVEETAAGLRVTTAQGLELETDYVLDATGRIPNVENLGLDELGIGYNRSGIVVMHGRSEPWERDRPRGWTRKRGRQPCGLRQHQHRSPSSSSQRRPGPSCRSSSELPAS